MMRTIRFCLLLSIAFSACTPKTTQQTQSSNTTPTTKPAVSNSPCATFKDSKAGEAALDAHVIYRDFLRREDYAQALPYWREAFKAAPAADGQRTTHFDDGVTLYGYLISQQKTIEQKRIYLDSIFYLYDRMKECYPEIAYADAKKAFDLYYNYRELADNKTIFSYFTKVLDKEGMDSPAFVINPFTALLVEMFNAKELDQETAVRYARLVIDIVQKHSDLIESAPCEMNLKYEKNSSGACVGVDENGRRTPVEAVCCEMAEDVREGWPIVIGYAPTQLEAFEAVDGFYSCDYFIEKYYDSINLDSVECDDLPLIYAQLKRGNCPESTAAFAAIQAEFNKRCVNPVRDSFLICGQKALEEKRYRDAIECYKKYVASTDDREKKARYSLFIAKIYYGQLREFPNAREHARLALSYKPGYGEAYLLIGKLYASSGPLCGPGRGWESQVVTWPAIDMFQKAAQDPATASEARKLIREYSRYMPSIEDIFQRQLKVGDQFFVGCWIQEWTTIRAAQ